MDSHSHSSSHSHSPATASANNRLRFQIPTLALPNNNNDTKAASGRFEFGAAGEGTRTTDQATTGTNNFPLYSPPPSSLNAIKSTVLPTPVSFDSLMFEAMGKNNNNNHGNGNSSKVSKMKQTKSGRRSSSVRVPAKDLVHNYSFQSVDHRANFDQFLFDRAKPSLHKHTFRNDDDDNVFDQFRNLEPFRAKIDGVDSFVSNGRHADDTDIEYSLSQGQGRGVRVKTKNLDDVVRGIGSQSCNGRENVGGDASEEEGFDYFKDKAFVFGASEMESSVSAESPGKFQSDRVYGEFEALGGDYVSTTRRSAFGRPSAASGSLSPMNNRQVPSMNSFSAGGRSDSKAREKESVTRDSSVGQSDSFGSTRAATSPTRLRVSVKDINNQVAMDGPHGRGGASWKSSPVASSMFEDLSMQRGESLHSVESLPANLNHTFQFGVKKEATMGHRGSRKAETNNVPSSSSVLMGYQFPHLGGELRENAPLKYDNTRELKQSSMPCANHFQSGNPNQHNLHQSDIVTNVKEAMATNANSQADIDEQTNADVFCKRESLTEEEHQFRFGSKDWKKYSNPDRSSKWTSSSFNQNVPVSSSAADWLNCPFEKVITDNCENGSDNTTAVVSGSIQRRRLTSKPSSGQGFPASGHARKSHRTLVEGTAKFKTSIEKFESSPFALRPLVFQTESVQRYASSSKGDLFDSNQIADEGKKMSGACDRHTTAVPESTLGNQSEKSDLPAIPMVVKNAALEQACESWRHRGNQAYTEGEFSKAEEYYSRGISGVSLSESSEGSVRALVLCYGNRAATRMAISRVREALSDCMQALNLDPNFIKARIRAASCYLALGECELASTFFNDCLKSVNEFETVDFKLASEASEGIKKTQQADEKMVQAVKLLSTKKSEDVSNSLCLVNEALSISPHSEKLFKLKAQALLSLCKYEDVIQACEEGLASFNQNHYCGKSGSESQMSNAEAYGGQCNCSIKLWLWQMTGKAQFYLGRLDEALISLLKYEEANTTVFKSSGQRMETLAPLIATIRDLLHHKAAGNEAFQANKFAEAEKHYTAALTCNTESMPFTAVCFCNRAATSHAQGHIADAIADCSRAMALDSKYLKAISRRSILHEMIRNYGQAISDLQSLITLQEIEQQNIKGGSLRRTGSSCNSVQDLKDARERLTKAQENMKKGIPLDHYLILGVESSSTAAEIKKAYRKAALKHHPDKAVQFLVRSDVGDDELLKDCGEEVRRDAEKLFQMIAEAYATLSDPGKRLRYDAEEELRKLQPTRSTSMAEPESQSNTFQFEKSSRQHREGWDAWKDYENQYSHWQSHAEGFRADNNAHQGPKNTGDGVRWNDHKWSYI